MRNVYGNTIRGYYFENNTHYMECKFPLDTTNVEEKFIPRMSKWKRRIGNGTSAAIVLGSDIWDILRGENNGPYFTDHLQAAERWVQAAREIYPNALLIWK